MHLEKILAYSPGRGLAEESVDCSDDSAYRGHIKEARNVLIKAGSDVLMNHGCLDREIMHNLAEQMVFLKRGGYQITFVTSGARRAGEEKVGRERAAAMDKRTLCAIGQSRLQGIYGQIFGIWKDVEISQHLLKDSDFQAGSRQDVLEGFWGVYRIGGIPIVNANDATWPGETEQDNDELASRLCDILDVDFALYLTTVDGLMKDFKKRDSAVISRIYDVDDALYGFITEEKRSSAGGMGAKIRAMKGIIDQGRHAVIANGKQKNVILDVVGGKNIGSWFCSQNNNFL